MSHLRMKNKKTPYFLIAITIGSLVHCRSFFPFSKDTSNYHSPYFECNSQLGWWDMDSFQNYRLLWKEIRSQYQIENANIRRAKVVIVGNSLVHLFTPELMIREFPKINIVNRGIGGDMTETLLERIQEDALALKPDTVVIEIGGNDLIQGKCLSFIENNYRKLVDTIRKDLPKAKIVFISIPPTDVANLNAVVPVINGYLSSMTKQYSNIVFIDTWTYMRSEDIPTIKRELLRDGGKDKIHFNENGYVIWGRLIRPHL